MKIKKKEKEKTFNSKITLIPWITKINSCLFYALRRTKKTHGNNMIA